MHSKQILATVSAVVALAVVFAEPPVSSYGPPGYTAPRVISSGPSTSASTKTGGSRYTEPEGGEPEPFNYAYEVKDSPSGNDFGATANSDGKRVQGEYRVLLPDGRRQVVKYTADDGGYNADVQYEGQARFPAQVPYVGPTAGSNPVAINTNTPVALPKITTSNNRAPSISPIVVAPSPASKSTFSGYRY